MARFPAGVRTRCPGCGRIITIGVTPGHMDYATRRTCDKRVTKSVKKRKQSKSLFPSFLR